MGEVYEPGKVEGECGRLNLSENDICMLLGDHLVKYRMKVEKGWYQGNLIDVESDPWKVAEENESGRQPSETLLAFVKDD